MSGPSLQNDTLITDYRQLVDVMASGEAAMTFTPVVDMTNLSPANIQQLVGNAQLAVASQLAEDRQAAKMTTDLNSMRAPSAASAR